MTQLRVFFNQDCMMYGVQELRANINYQGDSPRWTQILPPKGKGARKGQSAYTYYKGVAERWKKELERSYEPRTKANTGRLQD